MDFVSNHWDEFSMPKTAWSMGFIQTSQYFVFEIMNSYMLLTRGDIRMVLGAYANIYILYAINVRYFNNAVGDIDVLDKGSQNFPDIYDADNAPEIKKMPKFSERSCMNACTRVIYLIYLTFYGSLFFYFIPYVFIIVR